MGSVGFSLNRDHKCSSLGEHSAEDRRVEGSIPSIPIFLFNYYLYNLFLKFLLNKNSG